MFVFDNLLLSGSWVFDDLDESALGGELQYAFVTLTLSGGATQSYDGIFDQVVDIELVFDPQGAQEFVAPEAAVAYGQFGNAQTILFGGALHEHVPIAAGEFGQTASVALVVILLGTQEYLEADLQLADVYISLGGFDSFQDYVPLDGTITEQDGDAQFVFEGTPLHDWEDPFSGPTGYAVVNSIPGIVDGRVDFNVVLSPALSFIPSKITIKLVSSATEWVNNSGKGDRPVAVELFYEELRFASVAPEQPELIIEDHIVPWFDTLRLALAGEVSFQARGYERYTALSPNQPLNGQALLRIRAYP
jgi:hypothetical protein